MHTKTKAEIVNHIKSYGKAKVAITDIDGILRGKVMHARKFESAASGGFGFCDVVFGWDMADVAYDNGKFTGWHTGYPDADVALDMNTFRTQSWDSNIPFLLGDFRTKDGQPLPICPRNVLKKVRQQATDMGYHCYFAQEFEWFNFREKHDELYAKNFQNLKNMTPGMFGYSLLRTSLERPFFNELFDLLTNFGIPIEGIHTETGPGVYEAAIFYAEILEAADRAVLFKAMTKEIAHRHGIIASFMAKWNEQLPGCSGHVHQSLWDADAKNNLFYNADDPNGMSELMKSYIAGQLYCLPHVLPMYAPTINSYKRLVEGAWAPTTLTWAIDNRTVALRALPFGSKSCRLETRVVGSDSNPYLALAACLASGLYGIRHNLKLDVPATVGNGYENFSNGVLPRNLAEAIKKMKHSEVVKELFDGEFIDHFVRTREWECREYAKVVTDWELRRYFEIV